MERVTSLFVPSDFGSLIGFFGLDQEGHRIGMAGSGGVKV